MRLLVFILVLNYGFPSSAAHQKGETKKGRATNSADSSSCKTTIDALKQAGFVIPACPKQASSILPPDYPAAAIFLKPFTPGQFLDAVDMIRSLASAKVPVAINVMGRYGEELKRVISKELPQLLVSESGKVVQLGEGRPRTAVNLVSDPGTDSTFLHDFGKPMTSATSEFQFFTTRHAGNPASKTGSTSFGDFLKKDCGVSMVTPPPGEKGTASPNHAYGGNYIPVGAKHILTGGKNSKGAYNVDSNHAAHLEKLSTLGIGHTVLDTSFLRVGHVDEIIAPVPVNRSPPCNIGYAVADSELGWKNIEGSKPSGGKTGRHLFNMIPTAHASIRIIGKREQSPLDCSSLNLQLLEMASLFEAGMISQERMNQVLESYPGILVSMGSMTSKSEALYDEDEANAPMFEKLLASNPPKYRQFFQKVADQYCIGFSGIDKTEFKRFGISQRMTDMQTLNQKTIPEIMNRNIARLKSAAIRETGCKDPTIIRIPVIFEKTDNGITSVLPNSVNLVSLGVGPNGGQLLVPKSTSSEIDKSIETILSQHGISASFSSSTSCHLMEGNHSCSTSVFRLCSP